MIVGVRRKEPGEIFGSVVRRRKEEEEMEWEEVWLGWVVCLLNDLDPR